MNLVLTNEVLPLHEWLGEAATRTVVLCPASVRRAAHRPQDFAGWRTTPDYDGPITELLAAELVLDLAVDHVAGLTELDVLRVARLRELGGLSGQDVASARLYRDKWLMKSTAHAAGIAVPSICPIDSLLALRDATTAMGLPAVLKPRSRTGGAGVQFMMDQSDLFRVASAGGLDDLLLEQFVDAPQFTVEGLMRAGSVLRAEVFSADAQALRQDDSRSLALIASTGKLLAALGSPDQVLAFSAEFYLGEDGTPILGEVAARPGAALDLRREHLRGQLDLEGEPC